MVLKILQHIDIFFNASFLVRFIKLSLQTFFLFLLFLLQKIDNKVINKKPEITEIIKNFKQNLDLKSSEMNERRLKIFKKCIERNEKIVNNKDETDIEYINDELDTIKRVFNGFCDM